MPGIISVHGFDKCISVAYYGVGGNRSSFWTSNRSKPAPATVPCLFRAVHHLPGICGAELFLFSMFFSPPKIVFPSQSYE